MGDGAGRAGVLTGLGAARLRASDDRIVVTGAGGWLGRATLELLEETLGGEAFGRRVVAFGSNARPLATLAALPAHPTLVLHYAFLTRDRAETMPAAEYGAANEAIRATVLAALDPIGTRAVFVPSSGAVVHPTSAAMRHYGDLKRADEAAFSAWASGDRRAVVARIFTLSGRHINKPGDYALASFITDALAGRPIAIRADRPVWRSYLAIRELLSVVVGLMTAGTGPVAFDAAGREPVELADIAAAVGRGDVVRPPLTGPASRYLGDGTAYEAHRLAQRVDPVSFAEQVRETAAYLAAAA